MCTLFEESLSFIHRLLQILQPSPSVLQFDRVLLQPFQPFSVQNVFFLHVFHNVLCFSISFRIGFAIFYWSANARKFIEFFSEFFDFFISFNVFRIRTLEAKLSINSFSWSGLFGCIADRSILCKEISEFSLEFYRIVKLPSRPRTLEVEPQHWVKNAPIHKNLVL